MYVSVCNGCCYQGEHMVVRFRLCVFRMWIMQQKKVIKNVGILREGCGMEARFAWVERCICMEQWVLWECL